MDRIVSWTFEGQRTPVCEVMVGVSFDVAIYFDSTNGSILHFVTRKLRQHAVDRKNFVICQQTLNG